MNNLIYALVFLTKLHPEAVESRLLELAPAIADIASNKEEVALLVSTAYYETAPDRYNSNLVGKLGERSAFQILTNDPEERIKLKTPRYAAQKSIQFIRAANKVCSHMHPANRLGYYTTGRCMKEYSAQLRYLKAQELLNSEVAITDQVHRLYEKLTFSEKEVKIIKFNKPRELVFTYNVFIKKNTNEPKKEYTRGIGCPICNNLDKDHFCPLCKV